MLKFRNRDSLPVTPKSWTAPSGHRVAYDSVRSSWEEFVQKVMNYCDANGIERPALDALENHICEQMPSWACMEEGAYRARQSPPKPSRTEQPAKGCGACGKKRRA